MKIFIWMTLTMMFFSGLWKCILYFVDYGLNHEKSSQVVAFLSIVEMAMAVGASLFLIYV